MQQRTGERRRAGDNPAMAQGKRISADIGGDALAAIRQMGAAARLARTQAGEAQATAAARLGVHVQTIARIESGEPGVAIGHVLGLLALYGITAALQSPAAAGRGLSISSTAPTSCSGSSTACAAPARARTVPSPRRSVS